MCEQERKGNEFYALPQFLYMLGHACAACPTHVCFCIWRKRVYVIANKRFGLGDGTGPAEESKRTKRVQGWSRQIGLGTLFAIHTKLFSR